MITKSVFSKVKSIGLPLAMCGAVMGAPVEAEAGLVDSAIFEFCVHFGKFADLCVEKEVETSPCQEARKEVAKQENRVKTYEKEMADQGCDFTITIFPNHSLGFPNGNPNTGDEKPIISTPTGDADECPELTQCQHLAALHSQATSALNQARIDERRICGQ